jgi:hypothetical protein
MACCLHSIGNWGWEDGVENCSHITR